MTLHPKRESGETSRAGLFSHNTAYAGPQVFAYKYPELISGVALLDGYPDYRMVSPIPFTGRAVLGGFLRLLYGIMLTQVLHQERSQA